MAKPEIFLVGGVKVKTRIARFGTSAARMVLPPGNDAVCSRCKARSGWFVEYSYEDAQFCKGCMGTCLTPIPFTEVLDAYR